jgi:amidase
VLDHHPFGAAVHDECATAARDAATLLESLGHKVEEDFPQALANPEFGRRFGALWSTNMGAGLVRMGEQLGREITVERRRARQLGPSRVRQGYSGVDYAQSIAANYLSPRRAAWWRTVRHPRSHTDPRRAAGADRDVRERSGDTKAPMVRAASYVPFTQCPRSTRADSREISLTLPVQPTSPFRGPSCRTLRVG